MSVDKQSVEKYWNDVLVPKDFIVAQIFQPPLKVFVGTLILCVLVLRLLPVLSI